MTDADYPGDDVPEIGDDLDDRAPFLNAPEHRDIDDIDEDVE
jgi:hypothetical protein